MEAQAKHIKAENKLNQTQTETDFAKKSLHDDVIFKRQDDVIEQQIKRVRELLNDDSFIWNRNDDVKSFMDNIESYIEFGTINKLTREYTDMEVEVY